jgi:CHASE2 domain-containing sensor protein
MIQYLNTFLSNLKQPFRFRLWKYNLVLTLTLIIIFAFLNQSILVQDWENRFQPNFFAFKKSFFSIPSAKLPIVLVTISDLSLPNDMPRSPLNRLWLADLVNQLKKQQPAVIGLNILLDRTSEFNNDLKLSFAIKDQTIILRNNRRYPVLQQFSEVSESNGALRFKFDSSGTLQYICNAPETCLLPKQFHTEILKTYSKKTNQNFHHLNTNWLKINYASINDQNSSAFPIIQANAIEKLPPNALKDKIILVGTDFPDLYPLYRVPSKNYEMQETEVVAHTLESIASDLVINKPPFWVSISLALILLFGVTTFIYGNSNWLNAIKTILIIVGLYLLAALSFSIFNIELPFVLPTALLVVLFINHTGLLHFSEKVSRLETEVQLKQTKIDFLINELHSHNLFNELSRLSVLIRQKPDQAREYLIEFAEMLRASLKFGDQSMVPIWDQVAYLKSYIKQQQLIFGERLIFHFSIDEHIKNLTAPWHVFFPLAENAIKYTEILIKTNDITCTVQMDLKLVNDQIQFSISNPFASYLKVASTKTGIKNLEKRLGMAYLAHQFKLESQSENGIWTAKLCIPAVKLSS